MKNARIHLIYLAIIGFLAYQYWTKTQALDEAVGSIEQFDKQLKLDNIEVNKTSIWLLREIERQVRSYANSINLSFWKKAENEMSISMALNQWLESQKSEIINHSGGFDKTDSTILSNRLSIKPSATFFSNQKIQQIRDSLTHLQSALNNIADNQVLKELQGQYGTLKLLNDSIFWQKLKNGTAANALAQLTAIQNLIELDKIPFLIHIRNYVGGMSTDSYSYHVAIAPKKAALIEGETFKADVYLAAYSGSPTWGVTFVVNNQEIPMKDGVAHFETVEVKKGKKNVKAEARIKNSLTGETISQIGEFEYEVLPKCAKNCQ